MPHPASSRSAPPPVPNLEPTLAAVELCLAALGDALRERDSAGIDHHATELHRALAAAVDQFALAARSGSLPTELRLRLANAGGMVAAQRESLARATAALDRAIEVLIPRDSVSLYSTLGGAERADRSARGGSLLA
jgi:hypothetical protein